MTEILKNCPFCGGKAIKCGDNEHNPRHWVMCSDCHACPSGDVVEQSEAIAAWNSRVPEAVDAIAIIEARLPIYTDIGQINALRECISSIRAALNEEVDQDEDNSVGLRREGWED